MLLLASALVFASNYIGDPIECDVDVKNEIPNKVFEAHCWMHGAGQLLGTNNKPDLEHQRFFECVVKVSIISAIG